MKDRRHQAHRLGERNFRPGLPAGPGDRAVAERRDLVVAKPVPQIGSELLGGLVALVGGDLQGLAADRVDRTGDRTVARARGGVAARGKQVGEVRVVAPDRRGAGEDLVERGAEAVDVATGVEDPLLPVLLRTDVRLRVAALIALEGLAGGDGGFVAELGGAVEGGGQAPVDDVGLAVAADHDVEWLQIAVEDAGIVGIGDGVADGDEPLDEIETAPLPGRGPPAGAALGMSLLDLCVEIAAADHLHGIEEMAVDVLPDAEHRDDAGMVESAGNLGLGSELGAKLLVGGVVAPQRLDDRLAPELFVVGDEEIGHAAAAEEPQATVAGRGADRGGKGDRVGRRAERARQPRHARLVGEIPRRPDGVGIGGEAAAERLEGRMIAAAGAAAAAGEADLDREEPPQPERAAVGGGGGDELLDQPAARLPLPAEPVAGQLEGRIDRRLARRGGGDERRDGVGTIGGSRHSGALRRALSIRESGVPSTSPGPRP